MVCAARLPPWMCLAVLAQASLHLHLSCCSPARSALWAALRWEEEGGEGSRGTFRPGMRQALEQRSSETTLMTELGPAQASGNSRDSSWAGPHREKGGNTPASGVCNRPFPRPPRSPADAPPPCLFPGRRLTHDLFIKSHYLCQRRTELLAF